MREASVTKGRIATLVTNRKDLGPGHWFARPLSTTSRAVIGEQEKMTHKYILILPSPQDTEIEAQTSFNVACSKSFSRTVGQRKEDKSWFIARCGLFTSTVGLSFLKLWASRSDIHQSMVSAEPYENSSREVLLELVGVYLDETTPTSSDMARLSFQIYLQ